MKYKNKFTIFAFKLNNPMIVKNRIKVMLAETGHTGKWLAEQLDKNVATVSKWCTNTCQPDLQTLGDVAELLKCDIHELIDAK